MDFSDVIKIVLFYAFVVFIPSLMYQGKRRGYRRYLKGSIEGKAGERDSNNQRPKEEGIGIPVESRTVDRLHSQQQSRQQVYVDEQYGDKKGTAVDEMEEKEKIISNGKGEDFFTGDNLIKGIIIAELLQPPLSRRQNRRHLI